MKVWVRKYTFVVSLALLSSSLGVSGEDRTTTCNGVQDQLNSLKMAMEKLQKQVHDVAGSYMKRKIRVLEEEVKQLKEDNKKIVPLTEEVKRLKAETQKIQTLTEDVQQLKTDGQKIIEKMDEVEGNMHRNISAITDEVQGLKADNQKIAPLTERVQQLEADTQKIQTLTEDVQQLKTSDHNIEERMEEVAGNMDRNISTITEEVQGLKAEDQKLIERIDEVTRNISAITGEVQGLKAEDQIILEDQRDVKAKLRILWEPVEKSLFLKVLVTSPKARLYSGANFTGDFEDYTFETATYKGGCHSLQKLGNNVKSVDTFGKCVRLFDHIRCQGQSVSVYPGSGNAENVLNPNMTKVYSIGPCLAEEFEDFDFKDGTKQTIVKNSSNPRKYFPDSVQFYSNEKYYRAISPSGSRFSLNLHLLGPGNRLEFLRADISPKHLNISQPEFEMQTTSVYRSFEKEPGDIVGYGIPPSLGGPVNETYNAFPQTISGYKKWAELTSEIRPFLEGGGDYATLVLNFAYENEASRPTGFYFRICYYQDGIGCQKISYGRVEN